jgi:hypothetical protein
MTVKFKYKLNLKRNLILCTFPSKFKCNLSLIDTPGIMISSPEYNDLTRPQVLRFGLSGMMI